MPRPAVLPAGLDPVEEHGQVWLLDGSQCARHHGECSHTPEPHGPRRNGCDPPGWKLCAGRGGHHCLKHPLRDQSTLLCLLLANKDPGRHLRNAQPRGVPTGQHAGHPLCRHHVLYRRHRQLLFHGRPHERSPPGEPSLRARPPRVRGVPLVEYLHELLAVGGGAMPLGPSDPRSQGHRRHLPPGLAGMVDLVGATLVPLINYIIPILMYVRWMHDRGLLSRIGPFEAVLLVLEMSLSFLVLVFGSAFGVRTLVDQWGNLGAPFDCHCQNIWPTCACSPQHPGMEHCSAPKLG
mmetsp:Transcript_35356/g.110201  ORF Transcript_35356/g.110201 Transcript_35356/m.110201 type:complete len:293 (-) Transcript_35356:255-1133(-)